MSSPKLTLVAATRLAETAFWSQSALGLSLRRLQADDRLVPRIAFSNSRGLPLIYNAAIEDASAGEWVLFVHDDVWFDDFFIVDHVRQGLQTFDVIGAAGNRRRQPRQPGWAFASRAPDGRFVWDDKAFLSGTVAHGRTPFGRLSRFGPSAGLVVNCSTGCFSRLGVRDCWTKVCVSTRVSPSTSTTSISAGRRGITGFHLGLAGRADAPEWRRVRVRGVGSRVEAVP